MEISRKEKIDYRLLDLSAIIFICVFLFFWTGNSVNAASLPTPSIHASAVTWTNQDIHATLAGGGTLQYEIDGGGGNGSTASGGLSNLGLGSSQPDATGYWYAKDRFIDLGTDIPIKEISSFSVSSVTGGDDATVYSTNVFGSIDGTNWIYLGDARSNAWAGNNVPQHFNYPLELNGNQMLNAGFSEDARIRYVKAHNEYCLDAFWISVNYGNSSNNFSAGIEGTSGNYGGNWANYVNDIVINSDGVHSIKARAIDGNGNSSDYTLQYVYLDKTAPILNVTGNPTSKTHKNVTLQATAEDGMSGIKRIKTPDGIWKDGGTATYKISKNGNYTFIAEDRAGNQISQTVDVTNMEDQLWLSQPPAEELALNPITLTGTQQTIKFSGPNINLEDNRETGEGWHISVSASPFIDKKSHSLPYGSIQMKAPTITGTDATPTSPVTGYQAIDSGSTVNIALAGIGQGKGSYSVNMTSVDAMQVHVPADTYAGTYQTKILWQLVNAP